MIVIKLIACLLLVEVLQAQNYQDYEAEPRAAPARIRPGNGPVESAVTPVPILKQINRHNEDGSYTYGYEGADGSFKIETKLATGEVKGKYGYVDETGKVRVVEYGANKYGFQPSGEGITVAPPTLIDETTNKQGELLSEYEDVSQEKQYIARVTRPQPQPRPTSHPRPHYVDYDDEPELPKPQYAPAPKPQFAPAPRLQIPDAQPTDVVYSQRPRPARPDPEYSQSQTFSAGPQQNAVRISRPSYAPPPSVGRAQSFSPPMRPVSEPHSFQSARAAPQSSGYAAPSVVQGRSSSLLDQLAKDYALPQGGSQPLHDISFGYY